MSKEIKIMSKEFYAISIILMIITIVGLALLETYFGAALTRTLTPQSNQSNEFDTFRSLIGW